jgi:hypothetical protein
MTAAAALVILGTAVLLWPTLTVGCAVVVCVTLLAFRVPAVAFVVSVLLVAWEGSLKAMLGNEGLPVSISSNALGAFLLDLCLAVSVLGLVYRETPEGLVQTWRILPHAARIGLGMLAAWIAISAAQMLLVGSLSEGVHGFRLVQAYAVVGVGGALMLGRLPEKPLVLLLLGGFLIASAYATLRLIVGPSAVERAYNLERAGTQSYGGIGRAAGSFSAAVGLASFLVPAAVFALVLALALPAYRRLALAVFVCGTAGIIGSYVRSGVVALVAGMLVGGTLLVAQGRWSRRQRVVLAGIVAVLVLAGAIGTAVASLASPDVRERADVFVHPLRDRSLQLRFDTWKATLDDVRSHPLGTGVGSVGRASEGSGDAADEATRGSDDTVIADNSYLKVLHEQGWLGGTIFLVGVIVVLLALALASLDRARRFSAVGLAALAGASSFFVLLVGGEFIEQPGKALAWFLLGLAALELGRAGAPASPERSEAPAGLPNPLRGLPRIPPVAWVAAACLLVAAPVALTVARSERFVAAVVATPVGAPVAPSTLAASMRRLLKDPVVSNGIAVAAHLDIEGPRLADRFTVAQTPSGVVVSTAGPSPDDARRIAGALVPQLAQEAQRGRPFQLVLGAAHETSGLGFIDQVVILLPGAAPRTANPMWVALAGLLVALLAGTAIAIARPDLMRPHVRARAPESLTSRFAGGEHRSERAPGSWSP